jgi:hypothetical protein
VLCRKESGCWLIWPRWKQSARDLLNLPAVSFLFSFSTVIAGLQRYALIGRFNSSNASPVSQLSVLVSPQLRYRFLQCNLSRQWLATCLTSEMLFGQFQSEKKGISGHSYPKWMPQGRSNCWKIHHFGTAWQNVAHPMHRYWRYRGNN